ncbi:hypothetical protein ACFOYU_11245 [Microvirga sp. GCM10011540]|uniref:hypothetical protein n=1 Tax=Microvirga sp. GCM10011540 TaxID=3317338 RepID=UPI00361E777C
MKQDRQGVPFDYYEYSDFVRFDPSTGEITEHGTMQKGVIRELIEQGQPYLMRGGNRFDHYVKDGRRRTKSSCPAALVGMTLMNLPSPCWIEISEATTGLQIYEETDAAVELSFDYPGTYTIRVLSVPYTPGEFTVTVDG